MSDWDEFDWERSLRESDEFANRYFKLLRRFSDLPGADELISKHLDKDESGDFCDLDCENCDRRWDCDFALFDEWSTEWDFIETEGDDDDEDEPQPGDTWFYESHPCFRVLQKLALGWCNLYAAVLPPRERRKGLIVLYHLGRALGNLSYSIGDGTYEQPTASIAFAKRSLHHLHTAMKIIQEMMSEKPNLKPILAAMNKHFLQGRQRLVDHLHKCRDLSGGSLD